MTAEREQYEGQEQALRILAEAWLGLRGIAAGSELAIERAEMLRPGRPGLLDLVVAVGGTGRRAHLVVGLRGVTDEPHFLRPGEECALGILDDADGLAVCTDALRDAQLAPLLLATVRMVEPRSGPVTVLRDDDDAALLDCGDRGDLMVFPWVQDRPRPDVDLLVGLDEAGFNHVAAPLVRWVWEGRDLGVVQEPLADRSGGWALALTSLRDFYASGGTPEAAGGDFGTEARALGTMTARMHLALDRTFLRHPEPVVDWVDEAEDAIATRRLVAARRARRVRSGQVAARVRAAPTGHPDPRRLQPGAHGPHRPGLGGQRLRARWRARRRRPRRGGAPRWATWPTCSTPCTGPASWWRPSATRRGARGWPRSGRPGRPGTAGPS